MAHHSSHKHHDHHQASSLLKSPLTGQAGTRIIQIGIAANLGLALIKLVCGRILNSKALTADAWHSFSDLTTDFLALLALALSSLFQSKSTFSKSTTATIESLLAISASGALLATSIHLGWEAVTDIRGHMTGVAMLAETKPSVQAIWPGLLTLLVKESLYHATIKVANQIKSPVLASSAAHQRADSLLSVVTIITILGSNFAEGSSPWIDSIGGLCISGLVAKAALSTFQEYGNNIFG